jgi:hypothetical protein
MSVSERSGLRIRLGELRRLGRRSAVTDGDDGCNGGSGEEASTCGHVSVIVFKAPPEWLARL